MIRRARAKAPGAVVPARRIAARGQGGLVTRQSPLRWLASRAGFGGPVAAPHAEASPAAAAEAPPVVEAAADGRRVPVSRPGKAG